MNPESFDFSKLQLDQTETIIAASAAGAVLLLAVIMWGMIFHRAGYSFAAGFLMFVPIVNVIWLLVFAFSRWPVQKELDGYRRHLAAGVGPPGVAAQQVAQPMAVEPVAAPVLEPAAPTAAEHAVEPIAEAVAEADAKSVIDAVVEPDAEQAPSGD